MCPPVKLSLSSKTEDQRRSSSTTTRSREMPVAASRRSHSASNSGRYNNNNNSNNMDDIFNIDFNEIFAQPDPYSDSRSNYRGINLPKKKSTGELTA